MVEASFKAFARALRAAVADDPDETGVPSTEGRPLRPRVAILDYGMGNLRSVAKALEHVGADPELTADHAPRARGRRRGAARAWGRCPGRWSTCAGSASTS